MNKDVLIYDTENRVLNNKISSKTDMLRVFGAYSLKYDKYFCFFDPENMMDIQELFADHKILVGFNNKDYDNEILKRCGVDFEYKIMIDLLQIINVKEWRGKGRGSIIIVDDKNMKDTLDSYSMSSVAKWLNLSELKDDTFDYDVLQKPIFSDEDKKYIWNYLQQDLKTTKAIFEFLDNYFLGLKPFLSLKDQAKFEYVRTTTAVYAYKVICNKTGMVEEYAQGVEQEFPGAYVSEPSGEEYKDDCYCLDFSSLYPHIFIQCNLFSPSDTDSWFGDGKFFVSGRYNKLQQGKIEQVLQSLYNERLVYKAAKDPREYGLKIFMNSLYGCVGNPVFKNVHNYVAAEDCTQLGQQWIKLARKRFEEAGYIFIYTDTDSVYLKDPFADEKKLLDVKDLIIKEIKESVPFPSKTFDMSIDARIKYIKFFKGDNGKFKKKNYLYVTNSGKLKIKGLQIIKSNTSKLSKNIFDKHIKPIIINELRCELDKCVISKIVNDEIKKDLSLVAIPYKVKTVDNYKNQTSIQWQISNAYGAGKHLLIKNKKFGVGKDAKYCKIDEYKSDIRDLVLDNVFDTELGDFIGETKTKKWF